MLTVLVKSREVCRCMRCPPGTLPGIARLHLTRFLTEIMIELELERDRRAAPTLVEQVVQGFARAIDAQSLRAGALLPSVRQLAQSHALSTFTVTEAYNRLVSMGLVVARRGSGYRVAVRSPA